MLGKNFGQTASTSGQFFSFHYMTISKVSVLNPDLSGVA